MADEIKIKRAQRIAGNAENAGETRKPGPIKDTEVEGQSEWVMVQCPWCGGMVWAWDTPGHDTWSCAWCGGLFSEI